MFNGSGTYVLPGAALANGATVSATEHNQFRDDVATALSQCVVKDGQQTITANLPMNGKKLTGLAAGTTAGDSVRYEQVTSALAATGGTINGVVIGGSTAAAGAFTTLSASGAFTQTATNPLCLMRSDASNGSRLYSGVSTSSGYNFTTSDAIGSGTVLPYKVFIGASEITSISSTGLAVTGALSSSGNLMIGGASSATGVLTLGGSGNIYANGGATWYTGGDLYIRAGAGGKLRLGANNSNDLLTLDNSGNLGLGTSSSLKRLSVSGSTTDRTVEIIDTGANDAALMFQLSGVQEFTIGVDRTDNSFRISDAGNLGTNDRLIIDASGNLLVGQTSSGVVNINGISLAGPSGSQAINHINGTGSGSVYMYYGYNGSTIGSITQNGTTAVAYNTTSDYRLKTNIRPANAARFNEIPFSDFEWVDGRHDCGVIAHELQAIYPDLVIGEKDAVEIRQVEISPEVKDEDGNVITEAVFEEQEFPVYQQVNMPGLIGRMGTRIQIQDKALTTLETTVTAQSELIARLEERLVKLENK